MTFISLSDVVPTSTNLVQYSKQDGYFTFKNSETNVTYDYYCRTLQDFIDMIRQISCKKWYSLEIQRDLFDLYDNIVRK